MSLASRKPKLRDLLPLLLGLVAASCGSEDDPMELPFPLDEGATWFYEVRAVDWRTPQPLGRWTLTRRFHVTVRSLGVSAGVPPDPLPTILQFEYPESVEFSDAHIFGDTLQIVPGNGNYGMWGDPWTFVFPLYSGSGWSSTRYGENTTFVAETRRVDGFGYTDITSFRLEMNFADYNYYSHSSVWFTPGIGVTKIERSYYYDPIETWELIGFSIPRVGFWMRDVPRGPSGADGRAGTVKTPITSPDNHPPLFRAQSLIGR
jgi:hypothetical protein